MTAAGWGLRGSWFQTLRRPVASKPAPFHGEVKMKYKWTALYVAAIPATNFLFTHVGVLPIPGTGFVWHPLAILVGFFGSLANTTVSALGVPPSLAVWGRAFGRYEWGKRWTPCAKTGSRPCGCTCSEEWRWPGPATLSLRSTAQTSRATTIARETQLKRWPNDGTQGNAKVGGGDRDECC